jgi:hypothetical protein
LSLTELTQQSRSSEVSGRRDAVFHIPVEEDIRPGAEQQADQYVGDPEAGLQKGGMITPILPLPFSSNRHRGPDGRSNVFGICRTFTQLIVEPFRREFQRRGGDQAM